MGSTGGRGDVLIYVWLVFGYAGSDGLVLSVFGSVLYVSYMEGATHGVLERVVEEGRTEEEEKKEEAR